TFSRTSPSASLRRSAPEFSNVELMTRRVLVVGFDPNFLDFSSPELAPTGLNAQKILAGIKAEAERLRALGYDADMLLVDLGETAEAVVRQRLEQKTFD